MGTGSISNTDDTPPTTPATRVHNIIKASSVDSWTMAIVLMNTDGVEIVDNVVSRSYDVGIDIDTKSKGTVINNNLLTNNRRSPASFNKFCTFDNTCTYQPHAVLHLWNYNLKSVKNNVVAGTNDVGIMAYTLDSCDGDERDVFANNEVYGAMRGFHFMEHVDQPTSRVPVSTDVGLCSDELSKNGRGLTSHCAKLARLRAQGCVVPFSYDGESYTDCVTIDNDGVPWCATKEANEFDPQKKEHRQTCEDEAGSSARAAAPGGGDTCTRKIEGAKAWKNSHIGVYIEFKMPSLLVKNVHVLDNHIGLAPVGVLTGWQNNLVIKESTIAGSTPASTCDASVDCRAVAGHDVRGLGCNSVFGSKWRRVGVMLPQFNGLGKTIAADAYTPGRRCPMQVGSMCSLPFEKRFGNLNRRLHPDTLQAMNMHLDMRLTDVVFAFFQKSDCGKRSQAISLAPDQPDLSPTLHLLRIDWHETAEPAARMSLLDGRGAAVKMLAVNDLDGSTMASGAPGQLLPSWHETYSHGSIVTASGFADSTENCVRDLPTLSVQCSNLRVRHVIFEPLDAGRGMSIGPVTARKINWNKKLYTQLRKANYRSSQTAVEVHGEACARVPGFSRFELMLEPGNDYKIKTRAAMPGTMRLTFSSWPGADPEEGMILRLFYQQPFAIKVYADGQEVAPVPRQTVFDINNLQDHKAGDHTFDPQTRYLSLVVKGPAHQYQMIVQQQIQVTESLQMTPQQFYCDNNLDKFVSTMQRLLGKAKVAVVCVTPPGGACIKPKDRDQALGCRRWRKRRAWTRRQRRHESASLDMAVHPRDVDRRLGRSSADPDTILARAGNVCPAGFRKAVSANECKIAAWAVRATGAATSSAMHTYRGEHNNARLPSGCFWSFYDDGAYFNAHAQGQPNGDRRPYCFRDGFAPETTSTTVPTTAAPTPNPGADIFLAGAGLPCPAGHSTVDTEQACQASVALVGASEPAPPKYMGEEEASDWPVGCYRCDGVAECGGSSAWFNSHATGVANSGARRYCARDGIVPTLPSALVCGKGETPARNGRCEDCGWTGEPCCAADNAIGGGKCTLDADACHASNLCVQKGGGATGTTKAAGLGNFAVSATGTQCKNVVKLGNVAADTPEACLARMDTSPACSGYAFSYSPGGVCTCASDECTELNDDEYNYDVYKPVVDAEDFAVEYEMTPTTGKGSGCFSDAQGQDYRGDVAIVSEAVPCTAGAWCVASPLPHPHEGLWSHGRRLRAYACARVCCGGWCVSLCAVAAPALAFVAHLFCFAAPCATVRTQRPALNRAPVPFICRPTRGRSACPGRNHTIKPRECRAFGAARSGRRTRASATILSAVTRTTRRRHGATSCQH